MGPRTGARGIDPRPAIDLVVVEQQRLPREALCAALAQQPRVRCRAVASVDDLPDIDDHPVDCIVIAAHAPGADLVPAIAAAVGRRTAPVIALGGYVDDRLASDARDAGATAVLSTSCSLQVLVDVVTGDHGVPASAGLSTDRDQLAGERAAGLGITDRQLQVLRQLAGGATPQQIARQLEITLDTCRDHLKALRHALDCSNVGDVLVVSARLGLLPELTRAGR